MIEPTPIRQLWEHTDMSATRILETISVSDGCTLVILFRFWDDQIVQMVMPVGHDTFRACLDQWRKGVHAQHAFPDLDADQREFLISGLLPSEFPGADE
jgi:hypothetical protein